MYPSTNIKCKANLHTLVHFEETEDIQVNEESCKEITSGVLGRIGFRFEELWGTNRIGFCSNLHTLDIQIHGNQPILPTKFHFIKELKKLTHLTIKDVFSNPQNKRRLGFLAEEVFTCGIPSLTTLDFDGQRLGLNSFSFQFYFPNLAKLFIRNYSIELNYNFIHNLTNLDQLKFLTFEAIENLSDEHLIYGYDDFMKKKFPAIAGFKGLTHLHIKKCIKLTNSSLVNGLALCDKLEEIILCSRSGSGPQHGKFTKYGFDFLQKARNFIVRDFHSNFLSGKKFWL